MSSVILIMQIRELRTRQETSGFKLPAWDCTAELQVKSKRISDSYTTWRIDSTCWWGWAADVFFPSTCSALDLIFRKSEHLGQENTLSSSCCLLKSHLVLGAMMCWRQISSVQIREWLEGERSCQFSRRAPPLAGASLGVYVNLEGQVLIWHYLQEI